MSLVEAFKGRPITPLISANSGEILNIGGELARAGLFAIAATRILDFSLNRAKRTGSYTSVLVGGTATGVLVERTIRHTLNAARDTINLANIFRK